VDFNILEIEQQHMALYLEALPSYVKLGTILTFLDIASVQHNRISQIERRPSRKLRAWLHSLMMRRWEPRYAQRFDRCITVSEADRRLLLDKNPLLSADVIPNGVDTVAYQRLSLSNGSPVLLFVGRMKYVPCADAMLYFHEQILPIIRQKIPNVELWIVGSNPPHEVRQLEGDHVRVTGQVDDVLPYYERASVCVVPLRAGSGTRLKILEAMALGRPIVSTSIGAEGLDVIQGQHLLLADGPEQFAATTLGLLEDRGLQERLARNARQLVTSRYDWDIAAKQLMRVYEEVSG
jgi:glycosyltransferase involved in cell wall biosynthesis